MINKYLLRDIAPDNYRYVGYWDNMYHFCKGGNRTGFTHLSCFASDITNGNYFHMARLEITR